MCRQKIVLGRVIVRDKLENLVTTCTLGDIRAREKHLDGLAAW